jgi:ABC-type Fe3+-hydroxamate transport system substrate-binding protein
MQRKRIFRDQLNNEVEINFPPKRIVSIVPSQTEFLFDIGLGNEVVGITRFCIHPKEKVANTTKVGGTKTVNIEAVRALKPDLIIGNKEENELENIEELRKEFPVWMNDISTAEQAYDMMARLGELCDRRTEASGIIDSIRTSFSKLETIGDNKTAAYLIWRKPYMVAASGTFIDSIMKLAGFKNAFAHATRYPEIELSELQAVSPDVIMLSSEPYSFKPMHIGEFAEACPDARIIIVDGELFSWYGSRLLHTADYITNELQQLLNNTTGDHHKQQA